MGDIWRHCRPFIAPIENVIKTMHQKGIVEVSLRGQI